MSKTTANISIDADVKAKAQALFAELGLDLSTAIGIFLRQAIYENGIPFDVTREVPNETTLKAIENAENGINCSKPFDTVEDLISELNE